jgi:hypothetical protein
VYFAETSICCKHTVEGMSQQGGVAERRNCMLEEHVVTMLNGTHLPTHFWGKALYTYSRLLNMIPSAAIPAGTTLFEMVNKRKPDYSTLHVFGCHTFQSNPCTCLGQLRVQIDISNGLANKNSGLSQPIPCVIESTICNG